MNRITRDEFIEWIRQNFPDNVDIEFKRTYQEREFGKWVTVSENLYLDNSSLSTIRFADEP